MENTQSITDLLAENEQRLLRLTTGFDPVTGRGSVGPRRQVELWLDADGPRSYWLPCAMMDSPLVRALACARSQATSAQAADLDRLRMEHDFPYWAATRVYVKQKGGGDDLQLRLNHAQRLLIEAIERQRLAGRPIRIVLLKARQWGGSTAIQIYMAWLQLVRRLGLNSLIIAHQGCATDEIKDMFDRMLARYPDDLLGTEGGKKMEGVGKSRSAFRVPARNCKIKLGTAERPDSCRGGDYSLVHLSEVGLWRQTLGKKPEDIVRSACAGVLHKPDTMIVYESTANGVGNFFHREYLSARDNPRGQFRAVFVPWHQIEQNTLPFADEAERQAFAEWLVAERQSAYVASDRQESGAYLWGLWLKGATLEGINWYVMERTKHTSHDSMASECPSDDVEAFARSGANVFSADDVERLRAGCRRPAWGGDVAGEAVKGAGALRNVRFTLGAGGLLEVWEKPQAEPALNDRYVAVVDIGGRSAKADWSVVAVFDRAPLAAGSVPELVAQWRGHIDVDLLALKAAQIAAYYNEALLVIESNTLETHDAERQVDGDQSHYILHQLRRAYPHLYARKPSPEDIRQGRARRYGFHTNVQTKPVIISTLVEAVREGLYAERDERCLAELLTYERRPNGSYGAIEGAHDDLLMTRAIALHISATEMPLPSPPPDWSALSSTSLF